MGNVMAGSWFVRWWQSLHPVYWEWVAELEIEEAFTDPQGH